MENNYYMQSGAIQGWQCPVCKRVLSPWTQECPCKGQGQQTYTVGSTDTQPRIVPYKESTTIPKQLM